MLWFFYHDIIANIENTSASIVEDNAKSNSNKINFFTLQKNGDCFMFYIILINNTFQCSPKKISNKVKFEEQADYETNPPRSSIWIKFVN